MKMEGPAIPVIGVAIAIGNRFSRISIPSPDRDSDPDSDYLPTVTCCFRSSCSRASGALKSYEKTIAQSRDRKGADPLAEARGSVRAIFEADGPYF
jgi:hypothetical protein